MPEAVDPKFAPRILAIGVDAAEPRVVRALVERGQLPVLGRLLTAGRWMGIRSPSISSGAVWPTFFTGTPPEEHGVHSGWAWQAHEMSVAPATMTGLDPFWRPVAQCGCSVGVVDVPFAPHIGVEAGFEVTEWGPHDTFGRAMAVSPGALSSAIPHDHPFRKKRINSDHADDRRAMSTLARDCLESARRRGDLAVGLLSQHQADLALIVFPEVHHGGHELCHTLVPEHPLFRDLRNRYDAAPNLTEIYKEVDHQIGRLIDQVPSTTAVAVFSLHGMRPARGIVSLLGPVLEALGVSQSAGERFGARTALAAVKRHAPAVLKRTYHRFAPRDTMLRLARPTMLPAFDWRRTAAISLPSDQHGFLRINLAGRERDGTVPLEHYEPTRVRLETMLRGLTDLNGEPIVRDVLVPAGPPDVLPDLVVQWTDAAFGNACRVGGVSIEAEPNAARLTGQHTYEGFCVARGLPPGVGETVPAQDLHRLLTDALR